MGIGGIGGLHAAIERDLQALLGTGRVPAAADFSQSMGLLISDDLLPCYFFGDLGADLVMVNSNAEQGAATAVTRSAFGLPWPETTQKYIELFEHFGARAYAAGHRSRFDEQKTLPFLEGFMPEIVADRDGRDAVVAALDRKLQLELVPYSSPRFDTQLALRNRPQLEPHIERVLDVIVARPRRVVIFCSRFFSEYFAIPTDSVQLTKADGSIAQPLRIGYRRLKWRDREVDVLAAPSFARQGLAGSLMRAYGEACRNFLPRGTSASGIERGPASKANASLRCIHEMEPSTCAICDKSPQRRKSSAGGSVASARLSYLHLVADAARDGLSRAGLGEPRVHGGGTTSL